MVRDNGKSVRVVLGSLYGDRSPVATTSETIFGDVTLKAGSALPLDPGHEERAIYVIEGEIEMDMDNSTVKLRQGDIMIQRGTNHAWANRSDKRARVAFVLVDAEPLGIGKPVTCTASAR